MCMPGGGSTTTYYNADGTPMTPGQEAALKQKMTPSNTYDIADSMVQAARERAARRATGGFGLTSTFLTRRLMPVESNLTSEQAAAAQRQAVGQSQGASSTSLTLPSIATPGQPSQLLNIVPVSPASLKPGANGTLGAFKPGPDTSLLLGTSAPSTPVPLTAAQRLRR